MLGASNPTREFTRSQNSVYTSPMAIRVLLIEDDNSLANGVIRFLELNGLICDYCADGQQGINLVKANDYDVIVTDINMPRMSGFEFCQQLRAQGKETPVIMTSSRDQLDDKEEGFESGTDDYLVKPYEARELLMRVKALSKRKSTQTKQLTMEELRLFVDFNEHKVVREGQKVELSPANWVILEKLVRAWPEGVSKQDLEYALWQDSPPETDGLKVHMYHLRKKFDKPFSHPLIHAITGFGFILRREK